MLDRWIQSVCTHAGWAMPVKTLDDKYRFRLEPDMIVDASSLDERTLLLEARVSTFSRFDQEYLMKRAATAVLPRVFKDTATISLDRVNQCLCLHRVVTLGALRASDFPEVMENFINELVFYKSL